MPIEAPSLDTRTHEQLVEETLRRVPRYTPEWTDFNEHDPGVTLVELFATMTEALIYRLSLVPERHYLKFLQLLGIRLQPATPARADLSFTFAPGAPAGAGVPQGTQVAVAGADPPLVFETDTGLDALGAELAAVLTFDGLDLRDATGALTVAPPILPFGRRPRPGHALLLGFRTAAPFTSGTIDLALTVQPEAPSAVGHPCEFALESVPPRVALVWEYLGETITSWQPLGVDRDETRGLTRSGHVALGGPGAAARLHSLLPAADPLYWIRCRLRRGDYDGAPRLLRVLTDTVRASQAETARDEVLGGTRGEPDQAFRLAARPVLRRDRPEVVEGVTITSLRLEVDEGDGFRVWQEVDDFLASGPDQEHYVLDHTTGELVFGEGEHGRIPLLNPANPNANVVARHYRFGGGARGNVGAGTITEIQTFVEAVDAVANHDGALGGSNEETVDAAKRRAPGELKSRGRAVTAGDFELLARETPGARVRRAWALPLVHPQFRGAPVPGTVTVVVVPEGEEADPRPMPGTGTLELVCTHLNAHRLLTSELFVVPPEYHKIRVDTEVVVRADADSGAVRRAVAERLDEYFHPLRGGEDGTGWPFGGTIVHSSVCGRVLAVDGVERIRNGELELWLDEERQPFCRDVPIPPSSLLYTDGHDVRAAYGATP
jgi:predicted phage baseplate assembly protein